MKIIYFLFLRHNSFNKIGSYDDKDLCILFLFINIPLGEFFSFQIIVVYKVSM